jgi:hypothetical protein
MEQRFDVKQTAAKGGISGGVAIAGGGAGAVIVLAAKHILEIDIDLETGLLISSGITALVAGFGRSIESIVRFYVKMRKIANE